MFTQRNVIRRLAAKVLLVWLFALATGLVNACVIAPGTHASVSLGASAASGDEHDQAVHQPGCPNCDEDGSPVDHPPGCAKFCADESSSVPAAKVVFDAQSSLAIALVPTMALSIATPVRCEAASGSDVPLPPPRASVSIAYLRLTL